MSMTAGNTLHEMTFPELFAHLRSLERGKAYAQDFKDRDQIAHYDRMIERTYTALGKRYATQYEQQSNKQ